MSSKIGEKMQTLRGEMSQRQAALMCGIKPQNWVVYERGDSTPGAKAIIAICQTFGVSADWLLGLSDSPQGGKSPSITSFGDGNINAVGGSVHIRAGGGAGAAAAPGEAVLCRKCRYRAAVELMQKKMGGL